MADILSWDYTDDMAFDALTEMDEDEVGYIPGGP